MYFSYTQVLIRGLGPLFLASHALFQVVCSPPMLSITGLSLRIFFEDCFRSRKWRMPFLFTYQVFLEILLSLLFHSKKFQLDVYHLIPNILSFPFMARTSALCWAWMERVRRSYYDRIIKLQINVIITFECVSYAMVPLHGLTWHQNSL